MGLLDTLRSKYFKSLNAARAPGKAPLPAAARESRFFPRKHNLLRSPLTHVPLENTQLTTARLLHLPQEVKDKIWGFVFEGSVTSADLRPLLVCRRLYHEAADVAWASTVFRVDRPLEFINVTSSSLRYRMPFKPTPPNIGVINRKNAIVAVGVPFTPPQASQLLSPIRLINELHLHGIDPATLAIFHSLPVSATTAQSQIRLWASQLYTSRTSIPYLKRVVIYVQSVTCLRRVVSGLLQPATGGQYGVVDVRTSLKTDESVNCQVRQDKCVVFEVYFQIADDLKIEINVADGGVEVAPSLTDLVDMRNAIAFNNRPG